MSEVLAPAIRMAKEGIPEHELNARAVRDLSYDYRLRAHEGNLG